MSTLKAKRFEALMTTQTIVYFGVLLSALLQVIS